MTEEAAAPVCSAVDGLHLGLLLVPSAASRSYFRESGETAEQGGAGADVTSPLTVQPSGLQPGASAGEERASPERAAGEVFVGASGAVSRSEAVGSPSGHAAGKEAARKRKISSLEEQKGWEAEVGRTQEKGEPTASREEDETGRSTGEAGAEVQKKRRVKAKPARAVQARHFKGDVEEGTEYLFKTHMCSECKRCFRKRTHLVEHLHLHFPDPSLQCPNCQKFFTSRSKLKIHLMREVGEKSHCCPLCDYSSVEKNALNRHMACMHDNISNFYSDVYPCPVCEQKFQLSHALKDHLKSHKARRQQLLRCFQEGCDCSTEDRREFVRHLKEAHGAKAVECRYHACSLLFPTRDAMEAHRKSHYAFHCEQCDFVCSNKHAFRAHKRRGHAGSEELRCDFCPYTTFNPVEFADHVGKMHANEKIHKCGECDFATAHKRVLHRHTLLHTGEKPHKCALCDFTCRDLSYLSKHMLTHSSDKNYMCTECGYVTKWKHYLSVHMRKHTGDLRYQCNQCSYRCHQCGPAPASHKLRHQGKSLICEVCGFACKRKYERRSTCRRSTSQNYYQVPVFQCQYCSYQTKYKQALLNHENCKHTKQKLFRCALCVYHTFSNTSLFFHKRKAHGYVPGDKDWLENYASKEMEVSSANLLLCYDVDAALRSGSGARARGELWQKDKLSAVDNDSCQQAFAVPLFVLPHSPMEKNIEMAGTEEPGKPDACAKVSSATDSADLSHSTLDGLHARGGSPLSFEHLSKEPSPAQLVSMETLRAEADTAHKDLASSEILVLEDSDNSEEGLPDFEEGNDLQEEEQSRPEHGIDCCPEEASDGSSEESMQCDSQSNCEQQSPARGKTSCAAGLPMRDELVQSQETWASTLTAASSACELREIPLPFLLFVCSRASSISSHIGEGCRKLGPFSCSLCSEAFRSRRMLKRHRDEKHKGPESVDSAAVEGSRQTGAPEDEASPSHNQTGDSKESSKARDEDQGTQARVSRKMRLACSQQVVVKGCKTSAELRCVLCPFVCQCARALKHHKQLHRKYGGSKRPQLQCRQCDFTCKQSRCMKQHVRIRHEGMRPHKCRFCDFSTTRRYRLEAHESLHTGLGRIACDVCSQTFGTNSKLRIHKLRVHEKKPTHFCPLCDYSGYSQNDITRHTKSCHSGELSSACPQCPARFSSETALKQHTLRKHEEKVCFSCPRCAFTCHSEATLKCHLQKLHPHLECGACGETFGRREDLEEHKKSHFGHHCQHCSFACKERQQLVHHYVEEHETGEERPFACTFCSFTCCHQLVFDYHMKGHGGTRLYKCADCEYATKNRQKITWHIRIHTGEKPYKCHLCKYACADPSRLKYHMRIHKEERKYLCPDCGYKCKWVNQLKYHRTKHTGIKPYQCDKCDYRTNRADALRIHKETRHQDARTFICEQCGKAFKTRFLLKTHLKKHSEDKPYVCNVCLRNFRWAAGLRHHYLIHTKQHPFYCRFCTYKAKQKFQVIKHIQRHHPQDAGEDPSQGVGKDLSTSTIHLQDVQLERLPEESAGGDGPGT
ncbi:LOW QUALITY PROTEIN: zinc finger protein 142 [Rhinatrema bivittatum]|uniref:LOW QUALITY PROTEIN: zinc finger protein 142 n=1 Tax=Rhinatrema bivittatum TaxID=194408 RepID=UPI0011285BF8|nr:LOW QUALITY PROTEIN: zinc finger protein 142 [Rhinatrema bivittatum]